MALYMPVTKRSNEEIKNKLGIWNNLLSQTDLSIVPRPNQDIILGVYSLTNEKQKEIDETIENADGTIGKYLIQEESIQNEQEDYRRVEN